LAGDETALQNVKRLDGGSFRGRPQGRVDSGMADPLSFLVENVMMLDQSV
jgi:hypothetical protein